MPTISAFLSQPNRAYSSLTIWLETVIIEVSTVEVLRLRTNPWQLHKSKHLPPTNGTPLVTQDFTVAKLAILI